ncbi:MAG: hypothetical protein HYU66_03495 [Armatimonadetes bacterium]|nr:hypothetical protein [Armatimonadota bacterium]
MLRCLAVLLSCLASGAFAALTVDDLSVQITDTAVHLCWTTAAPTHGRVEYGPTDKLGSTIAEDASGLRGSTNTPRGQEGIGYANNHRCDLPLTFPLRYQIRGEAADGTPFSSLPGELKPADAPAEGVERGRVPLRVDPGGWTVPAPPVTVGVPFAPGQLGDPRHVRLLAGEREIPVQAEAVSRWASDHSVKWLRVSFEAPAEPVALEYGRAVRPAELPALAAQSGEFLQLRAGGLTVAARPDCSGTIATADGAKQVAFPQPVLVDEGGRTLAAKVEQSWVEESGPVAVVLALRGHFFAADGGQSFGWWMRLHGYAGKPYLRLDFTLDNDLTLAEMSRFRSLALRFAGLGAQGVTVGDGADLSRLAAGQSVLQREDSHWVADGGKQGKRLAGIVEAAPAWLLCRNFWEQYPAGVSNRAEGLEVGLYPALPEGFYAKRPDEDKLYYHLRDGLYTFRQGFSKTHELWLDLSGEAAARSLALDPPTAAAPPEWIEASGAMRDLAVAARDQFPGYDERLKEGVDRYLAERDSAREYGLMSFGDWYGERGLNWGNLEYDLGHALLMQYARTGYAAYYHRAAECLRHEGDVDTRHAASDARRVGQQWTHSMGHTAGYYPPSYRDMEVYASPGWSDNRGHVWAQGLFEHYLFGGDRRSWENARLIADWAAGPQTTNFQFGNAREPGWMLILVMSAYRATEDDYYLNAAKLMIRAVRRASDATGDHGFYYHQLPNGHCDCPAGEKHYGEAGFMLGVLMTGMKMTWEVTGDQRTAADIVKIARFVVDQIYVPEKTDFRYTSCPKTSVSHTSVFILLEGLAFAANHTRDAALVQVVRDGLAGSWGSFAGVGKSGGYILCALPQGLAEFGRLPGESFADRLASMEAWRRNPVRRPLPALVPNPDFEVDAEGWVRRAGVAAERTTAEAHSGSASLHLVADLKAQGEYVNTRYDTALDPYEIVWLKPGEKVRLTAWLKVTRLSAGAPAPSLRIQFRDASGSKGSAGTNAYDLTRLGTWQKLTCDATLPDYNTRNYLALNTNTRGDIQGELYLDDVTLTPAAQPAADAYTWLRLEPGGATLAGPAAANDQRGDWLRGRGRASWTVPVPHAGSYAVWARLDARAGEVGSAVAGDAPVGPLRGTGEPAWCKVGTVALAAGTVTIAVDLAEDPPWLGRVVITDEPGGP